MKKTSVFHNYKYKNNKFKQNIETLLQSFVAELLLNQKPNKYPKIIYWRYCSKCRFTGSNSK